MYFEFIVTSSEHFFFLKDDSSKDGAMTEQKLLNTLVASLVNKNEVAKTASAFLEANSEVETCHELLTMLSR